jgi:integrase
MVTIRSSQHPRYKFEATWKEAGVAKRKFFTTRRSADLWRITQEAELMLMTPTEEPITADERAAIMLARREGISPDFAIRDCMRRRQSIVKASTLTELIQQRSHEVKQVKRCARYQKDLARFFEEVENTLGSETLIDGIHAQHLAPLVYIRLAAATVEKRRLMLYGLFETAKNSRQIESNPVAELRAMSPDADGEVGILTPTEAQTLWAHCLHTAPAMAPALAIAMWGGLRQAEIEKLDWRDIKFKTNVIHVGATKAKNRQRRLVTIEQPLLMALEPFQQESGAVWPKNGRSLFDTARRAAGWQRRASNPGRPWPHNALRHSFVTYHLAFFQDAARTALQAGHGQDILFRHYRELATLDDAAVWWSVWTPDTLDEERPKGLKE